MENFSDFYANDANCVNRLYTEWLEHKSLIVAFDYDNTVNDYSNNGNRNEDVISVLRECKKLGFHLILFTSCNQDRLTSIEEDLKQRNIPYDFVNETPDFIPFKGRKVYYNILLDDRAGLSSALDTLWKVIYSIRGYTATKNLQEIG